MLVFPRCPSSTFPAMVSQRKFSLCTAETVLVAKIGRSLIRSHTVEAAPRISWHCPSVATLPQQSLVAQYILVSYHKYLFHFSGWAILFCMDSTYKATQKLFCFLFHYDELTVIRGPVLKMKCFLALHNGISFPKLTFYSVICV